MKAAYLIRLVVMDGQAIALVVTYIVNILPHHHDSTRAWQIAAGDQLEQRGFPRPIWPHHTYNRRFLDAKVCFQREGDSFIDQAARIFFAQIINFEKWHAHYLYS